MYNFRIKGNDEYINMILGLYFNDIYSFASNMSQNVWSRYLCSVLVFRTQTIDFKIVDPNSGELHDYIKQ